MKSERRHELEANSLALWLKWRAPELLERYGTKVLLGVVVVALAVVIIRYRINAPRQAAANAADYLTLAQEYVMGLEALRRTPGEAKQATQLISTALDESDDPIIQARAYLTLGDYYWALANYPAVPEAATRPALRPELPRDDLLAKAAEAFGKVVASPADPRLSARALLSLGVVAEARARDAGASDLQPGLEDHWKNARQQYEKVLALDGAPQVLKDEAQWHLDELTRIQQPVWLVPATQPATAPATAPAMTPTTTTTPTTPTTTTAPATIPSQQ